MAQPQSELTNLTNDSYNIQDDRVSESTFVREEAERRQKEMENTFMLWLEDSDEPEVSIASTRHFTNDCGAHYNAHSKMTKQLTICGDNVSIRGFLCGPGDEALPNQHSWNPQRDELTAWLGEFLP